MVIPTLLARQNCFACPADSSSSVGKRASAYENTTVAMGSTNLTAAMKISPFVAKESRFVLHILIVPSKTSKTLSKASVLLSPSTRDVRHPRPAIFRGKTSFVVARRLSHCRPLLCSFRIENILRVAMRIGCRATYFVGRTQCFRAAARLRLC